MAGQLYFITFGLLLMGGNVGVVGWCSRPVDDWNLLLK